MSESTFRFEYCHNDVCVRVEGVIEKTREEQNAVPLYDDDDYEENEYFES